MSNNHYRGMGFLRDLPDFRDYTAATPEVKAVLRKSKALKAAKKNLPTQVDLRAWCSPIETQGNLGSCTAQAGVGLLEYFQRRAFSKHLDGSRRFLYKVTRKLMGWQFDGDTGAYMRTAMSAMILLGLQPWESGPQDTPRYNEEPSPFCFAFAQNFKTIRYYRLDPPGTKNRDVLKNVKTLLAAELPSMFGFSVYSSIPGVGDGTGDIPYPSSTDSILGGHALVAVGYDDQYKIGSDTGALLVRNSWSTDWGEGGYGWLPYSYVTKDLAFDFWSLVQAEFVDTDLFA